MGQSQGGKGARPVFQHFQKGKEKGGNFNNNNNQQREPPVTEAMLDKILEDYMGGDGNKPKNYMYTDSLESRKQEDILNTQLDQYMKGQKVCSAEEVKMSEKLDTQLENYFGKDKDTPKSTKEETKRVASPQKTTTKIEESDDEKEGSDDKNSDDEKE